MPHAQTARPAAQRLAAEPGERVLDVATGTGWTARNIARAGAHVTAVDIAPDLLAAGEARSAHLHPPITFQVRRPMRRRCPSPTAPSTPSSPPSG